jgi:hypothetical protein
MRDMRRRKFVTLVGARHSCGRSSRPDEQPTSADSCHRPGNFASIFHKPFRQWTQRAILYREDADGALLRWQFDGQYLERQAFAAEPHSPADGTNAVINWRNYGRSR